MKAGALITAAGRSSRMGAFKPLLPLGKSTVIRTALTTLLTCGVAPIVVVTGREAELLRQHIADLSVETVHNADFAITDMFYSAGLGFRALTGRCDSVLFTPVDSPLFAKESVWALLSAMERTGCHIVTPAFQGRQGHPVLLAAKAMPQLLSFRGPGGLKGAIDAYVGPKEVLELADPGLVLDADDPAAYARLQAYRQDLV